MSSSSHENTTVLQYCKNAKCAPALKLTFSGIERLLNDGNNM